MPFSVGQGTLNRGLGPACEARPTLGEGREGKWFARR